MAETPVTHLEGLLALHEDFTLAKDLGIPTAAQDHRQRADHGVRQYIKAVQTEKDMGDLI